jgi:hypothetical protein
MRDSGEGRITGPKLRQQSSTAIAGRRDIKEKGTVFELTRL